MHSFEIFYATRRAEILCHLRAQVNVFSGAFYDGVYLLGLVLNETLSEGGDIRDGINLTRKMWNRDFHGERIRVMIAVARVCFVCVCI